MDKTQYQELKDFLDNEYLYHKNTFSNNGKKVTKKYKFRVLINLYLISHEIRPRLYPEEIEPDCILYNDGYMITKFGEKLNNFFENINIPIRVIIKDKYAGIFNTDLEPKYMKKIIEKSKKDKYNFEKRILYGFPEVFYGKDSEDITEKGKPYYVYIYYVSNIKIFDYYRLKYNGEKSRIKKILSLLKIIGIKKLKLTKYIYHLLEQNFLEERNYTFTLDNIDDIDITDD